MAGHNRATLVRRNDGDGRMCCSLSTVEDRMGVDEMGERVAFENIRIVICICF